VAATAAAQCHVRRGGRLLPTVDALRATVAEAARAAKATAANLPVGGSDAVCRRTKKRGRGALGASTGVEQASPRVFRQGYHPSIFFGCILVPVRYFDASPILILANGTWPDTRNIESPRVSESTTRILNSAEADTLDSVLQCGAVTT